MPFGLNLLRQARAALSRYLERQLARDTPVAAGSFAPSRTSALRRRNAATNSAQSPARQRICSMRFSAALPTAASFMSSAAASTSLRAIGQAVYLFCFRWPLIIAVERRVDAAQHGFQRDAGIFPGFDQRPVESREQQASAAAAQKVLFNLGEIIEVIFHGGSARRSAEVPKRCAFLDSPLAGLARRRFGCSFAALAPSPHRACSCVPLPDNAQSFESQKIVDMLDVLRSRADHRPQPAGRDHLRFLPSSASSSSRIPSTSPRYP